MQPRYPQAAWKRWGDGEWTGYLNEAMLVQAEHCAASRDGNRSPAVQPEGQRRANTLLVSCTMAALTPTCLHPITALRHHRMPRHLQDTVIRGRPGGLRPSHVLSRQLFQSDQECALLDILQALRQWSGVVRPSCMTEAADGPVAGADPHQS